MITGALILIAAFMAAEAVVGFVVSSVALIADAGHMLSDAGALLLALIAMRLAARPATGKLTFGYKRAEILSAQVNGLTLVVLAILFGVGAGQRLVDPTDVAGGAVLLTAGAGVAVNLVATMLLARADRQSLNVEGAFQHILTDMYAFLATAVSGLVILLTGFTRADPIAALFVAALMMRAGVHLLRESGRVFLQAAPRGMEPDDIGRSLAAHPHVREVHDLHVWEVTSGMPTASAHVLVVPEGDCHQVQRDLRRLLSETWGINHITLQVDHAEPTVYRLATPPPQAPSGCCALPA
jgi:cobalt-zinc-cadmium efflux system protein